MLTFALKYIAEGRRIFPLHAIVAGQCTCGKKDCEDAGKHPRTRRGVKEASSDEAQIREWFGPGAPPSNIGGATGAVSGWTVIDVDTANGKVGAESWQALCAEKGEPVTLMAQTGSGGVHVFFRYNAALKTAGNVLGPNIDCRNDGGYVVLPPSSHRSGGSYAWINEGTPLADLPAFMCVRRERRGRPRKDDYSRQKYTVEQVRGMLEFVSADDRDLWRSVGIILGRAFERSEEAWALYCEWSGKWTGKKGRNHDEIMQQAFHELSQQSHVSELTMGTIVDAAVKGGWSPKQGEVPIDCFVYYAQDNCYIYKRTFTFWVAEAVNAVCSPVNEGGKLHKPADWLRINAAVTSVTDDPDLGQDVTKGVDYRDGGVLHGIGAATYNAYRPAEIELGDARLAGPFLKHVRLLLPEQGDADQFLNYMAHRVQRPGEKPRFALLLAGEQGTGKDTAIGLCLPAIGVWNVAGIDPADLDSPYNDHLGKVLVRISEAANLQEMSKWTFNNVTKKLIAGEAQDVVQINPKYGKKYSVRMHNGTVLTTNHLAAGIYIPKDDRRYDVMQCATREEMGLADVDAYRRHFGELWEWANEGGYGHVAAYLWERNISKFSAANGQRKTEAHKMAVSVNLGTDAWLSDILEDLGSPDAVRSDVILAMANKEGLMAKDIGPKMMQALDRCGYKMHPNPANKEGRWTFMDDNGKRRATVYVKAEIKSFERAEALRLGLRSVF